MTDSEIIKALEIFVNSVGKDFVFANVNIKKDGINDFKHIDLSYDEIFALINRLQAENEKNENIIRLADKTIETANAEIERLKKAGEEAVGCFHRLESLYNIKCMELKVAKAEAYKECIEKVKEKSKKSEIVCSGALVATSYLISAKNLNNLLKELVGEDQ